jgi:hypothetical protein
MSAQESSYRRPNGLLKVIACLFFGVFVCAFVLTNWGALKAYAPAGVPAIILATPTTGARGQPAQPTQYAAPAQPAIDVNEAINNYNATQEAQFQQPAPVENVGQGEPAVLVQRSSEERLPAGEIVPTSLPLPQGQTDGIFGSKPAAPVNIQETHQCLHGQIWVEGRGCKNPTPVR